ncbi:shematrin-like protein 1 [Vanessa atalanta]|uniref:shematrin-like protein 1 n=1 Tax=Vanessa atalanta TaxID=42275 RepID=UPI001FCD0D40|nr:shematrin-like protein 1 [Vanessa atalanta]
MASRKIVLLAFVCLIAGALSAPAQEKDLISSEKEDLQTAASHWGGHYGGYGGWGGYGYYPHYGYGWGYPSYGWYGGWPYGGYYGHGYWW